MLFAKIKELLLFVLLLGRGIYIGKYHPPQGGE
jgi:hypothetical protein